MEIAPHKEPDAIRAISFDFVLRVAMIFLLLFHLLFPGKRVGNAVAAF
jgi:hypothetical protein